MIFFFIQRYKAAKFEYNLRSEFTKLLLSFVLTTDLLLFRSNSGMSCYLIVENSEAISCHRSLHNSTSQNIFHIVIGI